MPAKRGSEDRTWAEEEAEEDKAASRRLGKDMFDVQIKFLSELKLTPEQFYEPLATTCQAFQPSAESDSDATDEAAVKVETQGSKAADSQLYWQLSEKLLALYKKPSLWRCKVLSERVTRLGKLRGGLAAKATARQRGLWHMSHLQTEPPALDDADSAMLHRLRKVWQALAAFFVPSLSTCARKLTPSLSALLLGGNRGGKCFFSKYLGQ